MEPLVKSSSLALLLLLIATTSLRAVEHMTVKRGAVQTEIAGKLLVEAEDGGVIVLTPDGRLWAVEPQEIVKRSSDDTPYEPLSREALTKQLADELPKFRVHHTEHYVIVYNTSRAYAEWCGTLYERLYVSFYDYWKDRGLALKAPPMPLVALLFSDKKSYEEFARRDYGEATPPPYGYYNQDTNFVLTYDMTGVEGAGLGDRKGFSARINAILAQPGAQGTVATIIHEATHQLAYNSGMHQRRADIPRWLAEGMAIYFEVPDLKSPRGGSKIGAVHTSRLKTFHKYLAQRPGDSLATLIANDNRLTHYETGENAYAEAWALNYYLINKQKGHQYVEYLKILAAKEAMIFDTPEQRLKDFQTAFGDDAAKLDAAFIKFMRNVKLPR
jgi:hypothetical protein